MSDNNNSDNNFTLTEKLTVAVFILTFIFIIIPYMVLAIWEKF